MSSNSQANSSVSFKKADTNPFGLNAYRPKRRFTRRFAAIGAMLAIAGGVLIFIVVLPGNKKINSQLSAQLRVNEIIARENVARQDQNRLLEIFSALVQQIGIDASGWDFSNPAAEQLRLLERLAPPQDGLLRSYLAKRSEFIYLKQSIRELEARLGTPRLVRPGDTHFKMAYDFLISQTGRPDRDVRQILQQTRLQEPLLPGFKVWNFWLEDGFCTFVTQGEAPLTLEEARAQAMEKQRQEKKQALIHVNSMFLLVGTLKELQARQVLVGGFLKSTRLGEVQAAAFTQAMDLRKQREFRLQARDFKLKKITRLALFPAEFRIGIDYNLRISPQGRFAQVTILQADVFRGRRVVIAVE